VVHRIRYTYTRTAHVDQAAAKSGQAA
jgi:hypothetical protein